MNSASDIISQSSKLSPADIVTLSLELQALMKAGVPLDFGLRTASAGFSRQLNAVSQRIADNLTAGRSLEEALSDEPGVPPVYRAVLQAGLKAGRSAEVLSDIAEMTNGLIEFKQTIYRGMIYPLAIVLVAIVLAIGILSRMLPFQLEFYDSLDATPPRFLVDLVTAGKWVREHWMSNRAIAGCIVAFTIVWFTLRFLRRRRQSLIGGIRWIPGVSRVLRDLEFSRIAHMLAMMVRNELPLPEALSLTASTCNNTSRQTALNQMSAAIERGESLESTVHKHATFPTFLQWMIANGARGNDLVPPLLHAAEHYRHRARTRAALLQHLVPSIFLVVVGGGMTLLYSYTVFIPMTQLWELFSRPR